MTTDTDPDDTDPDDTDPDDADRPPPTPLEELQARAAAADRAYRAARADLRAVMSDEEVRDAFGIDLSGLD